MFPLLYGGSLCVIGGLALVVVAWMASAGRRKYEHDYELMEGMKANEILEWRLRYKRVATRCRELERELTEIKLGAAMTGYTFDQVPARTIPARVRMVKAR